MLGREKVKRRGEGTLDMADLRVRKALWKCGWKRPMLGASPIAVIFSTVGCRVLCEICNVQPRKSADGGVPPSAKGLSIRLIISAHTRLPKYPPRRLSLAAAGITPLIGDLRPNLYILGS